MLRYQEYITKSSHEILTILGSGWEGLSSQEARLRIVRSGPNAVEYKTPTWQSILFRQLNSFFIYLLVVAAAINFFVGERLDMAVIVLFILTYVFLGFYQEYKAENAITSLRNFLVRFSRVKRDGEIEKINNQELVPGDVVFLAEGDLVPADVRFLKTKNLFIDESVLTGESIPRSKTSSEEQKAIESDLEADDIGFFGSTVVRGSAEAVVLTTGSKTFFADIFKKISHIERPSVFETNIKRIAQFLAKLILIFAVVILLAKFLITGTIDINFFVFLIALVVAVVPEALPLVIAFAFSKGSLRLAKQHIVIKRLSAIEDLGSIHIICTDKTGTITKNILTVSHSFGAPESKLLELIAIHAVSGKRAGKIFNPFDKAILEKAGKDVIHKIKNLTIVEMLPFDPIRKLDSVVYEDGGKYFLVMRGAPEHILESAVSTLNEYNTGIPLSKDYTNKALGWFRERGLGGERVLGIGFKEVDFKKEMDMKTEEEHGVIFAGMISFSDPLKETSKEAFQLIKNLGINLKIITGDAAEVAGAVGVTLGLIDVPHRVLTGTEFEKLNKEEREEAVEKYDVFARTLPMHKYEIIELLKHKNSVAFLGEGFNDVPALKIADLALVVENASDMARNVADIVLLKDDLLVIAQGIEEGRRIFNNVIKYIRTTLAANIGNFFTIILASLILPFLPMLPIQILLLNLITDFPMISLSVDTVNREEIKKPEKYELRYLFLFFIIFGLVSIPFDFIFFSIFHKFGVAALQTNWFIYSVIQEIVAFFSLRTLLPIIKGGWPSHVVMVSSILAVFLGFLLPLYPFLREIFHFQTLSSQYLSIIFAILSSYFIVNEFIKTVYVKFWRSRK